MRVRYVKTLAKASSGMSLKAELSGRGGWAHSPPLRPGMGEPTRTAVRALHPLRGPEALQSVPTTEAGSYSRGTKALPPLQVPTGPDRTGTPPRRLLLLLLLGPTDLELHGAPPHRAAQLQQRRRHVHIRREYKAGSSARRRVGTRHDGRQTCVVRDTILSAFHSRSFRCL
ncbi:hypothetical protein EYF80_021309 [Liparis tanakae]|uniref:Uncharacterized protein n=1 Tax=Liparis tanakae TaxID=230148 RepID=A0A4Z2HU46_9TELE|nr:hypothetical protein EYF80_021309 [Liparis tanakae]